MTSGVWVIDDDRSIRWVFEKALAREGIAHRTFGAAREALALLPDEAPQVVVSDIRMPGVSGLELMHQLKARLPATPVIIMTAYSDLESAVAAFQGGAFEYLAKPFDVDHAVELVRRALEESNRPAQAAAADAQTPEILGQAPAMQEVFRAIGRLAQSHATVLITGESGTGKELVARALHRHSPRSPKPFIAINTAAIPKDLLESELFGHERGAFTGAVTSKRGLFEEASGGTLFLDEIGDVDVALQTKLLRVLADGRYELVGGNQSQTSEARIVSATHKPVRPGDAGSVLRDDLYYRLAVIEIEVPPLRARKSDIPLLVAHALSATAARAVSEETMAHLLAYRWPGNVRELIHVIQRAAALCAGEIIDITNLPEPVRDPRERSTEPGDENVTLKDAVAALEKRMIVRALERANGNRSEAARQLGIGRPQLYAKLEEYGLDKS